MQISWKTTRIESTIKIIKQKDINIVLNLMKDKLDLKSALRPTVINWWLFILNIIYFIFKNFNKITFAFYFYRYNLITIN